VKVCAKREASGGPCGRRSVASPVEVLDHKKLDPNVHELTTEDNLLRDFLIATLNTSRAGAHARSAPQRPRRWLVPAACGHVPIARQLAKRLPPP